MLRCNTAAMQWQRIEIAAQVVPGTHGVVLLDQAGWHTTDKLDLLANIPSIPLPPRSSELNPVENVWKYMRKNWLSNCVFSS